MKRTQMIVFRALLIAGILAGQIPCANAQDRSQFEGEIPASRAKFSDYRNYPGRSKMVSEKPIIIHDFRETNFAEKISAKPLPPSADVRSYSPSANVTGATASVEASASGPSTLRGVAAGSPSPSVARAAGGAPSSSLTMVFNGTNREELCAPGLVHWHANVTDATRAAAYTQKPILVLQILGKLDEKFC